VTSLYVGQWVLQNSHLDVYYLASSNDSRRTNALVYGVYLVETTQTFLLSYTAFKMFATGFGNINAIIDGSILWFSIPIMSSAGRSVNALRCSLLTKNCSGIYCPGLLCLPYQCAGEIQSRRDPHRRGK
jgi:hypothetical protein